MSKPLPIPDNLSAPYWEHLRQGIFALPRCQACGRFHFYPKPSCPYCRSPLIAWVPASGRGDVYSFSVVHRAPTAAFEDEVPYAIAIVRTDEGPHLMSKIVRIAASDVRIGLRVRVRLKVVAGETALPAFEPDGKNQPGDSNDG